MRLAVLGAGAWGTAISISLAARHRVTLWARDSQAAQAIAAQHENLRYLPGYQLPASVHVTDAIADAIADMDLLLVATPTAGLRPLLHTVAAAGSTAPVIWLCKGFESETSRLPHQIAREELPAATPCAALSGPSFAAEIARGLPAALTLAAVDPEFSSRTARELNDRKLRIYSSDDITGVEVAGAVKNVIAIAAGICDGLQLGQNARAALITRGMAEITRLGLRLGGRLETFMGLAGAGDLILTCTGDQSRNRTVGLQLARGTAIGNAMRSLGHVAEGVHTARAVMRLASQLGIDMPITHAVCRVMDEGLAPTAAVQELLLRDAKPEHH